MVIMIKKTGNDMPTDAEIAPDESYKGVQKKVLAEGRYFYNPYSWDWTVVPQIEIPEGKLGVRVRLYGDDLPPRDLIAWEENQKGIVPEVLRPGRYAINAKLEGAPPREDGDSYAEHILLYDPITIPAGFKGIVTELSAPLPDDTNVLLVEDKKRGVQNPTLAPSTYYVNPFVTNINLVDCRSQRFNLAQLGEEELGFPTIDGFWVSLQGIIEFRVMPEKASEVYVIYNDTDNGDAIDEEIISKIILPNARSFVRLEGSSHSGREFISGETRVAFQNEFQRDLQATCAKQGIEIIQALITKINPPEKIAEPIRDRQLAVQEAAQYVKEIDQQDSEKTLAIEKAMVLQKQELVEAEQEVVVIVTEANKNQELALLQANQELEVAKLELEAAKDKASATIAKGQAAADVIGFNNEAEAAGWKNSVDAFGGNGDEFARWTFLKKMAPAYQKMMVNTADSPVVAVFKEFSEQTEGYKPPAVAEVKEDGTTTTKPVEKAPEKKPAPKPVPAEKPAN